MSETIDSPPSVTTTRRETAQSRFIKILEATTDVVAMTDRRGQLLYLNEAGRRFFGWGDTDSLRNHSLREMHPPWAYELVAQEAQPNALRDGSWSGETALVGRNGREVPILQVVLAHHAADGQVDFYSTICRDISDRKQKELEHIEWANRYDAAVRASGQVLFDWDSATGAITYGGDVARLTGYSDDEMAGGLARLRSLVHPEDLAAFDAEIERVQIIRDAFHQAFRIRRKDGAIIYVEAEGFFFLDRQGRIGRMVGFLRDVTVHRNAERAIQTVNEQLERRVAERTSALELGARRQEAVARLGQRALAGLPLEQLQTEAVELACGFLRAEMATVLEYNSEDNTFVVRAEFGWDEPGKNADIPGGFASQSGYAMLTRAAVVVPNMATERRFQLSDIVRASGIMSGMSACIQAGNRPLGVLNVFNRAPRQFAPDDVSFLQGVANVLTAAIERHRVEEDLRRARAEAEAANRAKSEFLSRMSHELRTPLNAILGFTQLLEMEQHDERQAESILHISRAGKNLLDLINEVLDIARLDAGRMQFHIAPFELQPLLRETVMLSEASGKARNISVVVGEVPAEAVSISTDRERLKQVLLNLMSNAVKYNRVDGSVVLSLQRHGAAWRILVTDTGQGLAPENLARLFVPFERLGVQEGGTEGGTGLGLALCLRLMTALRGTLGVESTVQVGSTFWVELPDVAPEPAVDPPVSLVAMPTPMAPGTVTILKPPMRPAPTAPFAKPAPAAPPPPASSAVPTTVPTAAPARPVTSSPAPRTAPGPSPAARNTATPFLPSTRVPVARPAPVPVAGAPKSTPMIPQTAPSPLPRAPLTITPARPTTSPPTEPLTRQYTILYIEDDVANYYLLQRILHSRKELKLVSALQGSLGLELARSQKPDLILLDLNLPDMTGEQLLAHLKADPATARIPIVAVTGEAATDRPAELSALGVVDTLVKPYRVQQMTALLDQVLGIKNTPSGKPPTTPLAR
jgi:PAS domain S-box-containing protein